MKTLALALVVLGSACATDDARPEDPAAPKQLMQTPGAPTFSLFVSNQSLDRTIVDIQVAIDGQPAVAGAFNVSSGHDGEGCRGAPNPQHNWYRFDFALPAGAHHITVTSADVAATLDTTVAQRFGVLDYWYDAATDEPEHFGFLGSAEEPA